MCQSTRLSHTSSFEVTHVCRDPLWVLLGLLLWVVSLLNILIIYIFRVIQGFDLFNMYVGECYRLFIVTIVLSLVSIFVDFSWSLLFVRVSWGFLKCHL